jgi:hypothetical protein
MLVSSDKLADCKRPGWFAAISRLRSARSLLFCAMLATTEYGPCNKEPRADNHLTRAYHAPELPAVLPRAVAPETEHAFGAWDAGQKGSHEFVVRNEGEAPLTLSGDPSSDPDFVCEILRSPVPPGESGSVCLTWQPGREGADFSREVTVHTDDPYRRKLVFTLQGTVRRPLVVEPPVLALGDVHPDRSSVAETLLYSQLWPAFTVAKVDCSLAGATWTVEPAADEMLQACQARSGYRLILTSPSDLPRGPIEGTLTVQVTAQHESGAAAREETLELPIAGRMLRRLALYGDGLDPSGTLELGHLQLGEGTQRRLLMKIRDPEPDVKIIAIRCQPEFLKVNITSKRGEAPAVGLYDFNIEVSPDAPPCEYLGLRHGEVHVQVDHPRAEDLDLKVFFSVRPRR